jgi:rhomboid protease GluP
VTPFPSREPAERASARSAEKDPIVPPNWLEQAPVARTLIALNVAVFLVQAALTGGASLTHLPSSEGLAFGASYPFATVGENRWETLVTACFLHHGVVHLAVNMLLFWLAGPLVERAMGSARIAPMYLASGAFGNLLSVAHGWLTRTSPSTVGASGAISGVLAATLVLAWRIQGWRGVATQAAARWLGLAAFLGVLSWWLGGGLIDNASHIGGALCGAAIATIWSRDFRYSPRATAAVVSACAGILVACIAVVAIRDRTDRFAVMDLQARDDFTLEALREGRCGDAYDGLRAVERLRATMGPVRSLRQVVAASCGHLD